MASIFTRLADRLLRRSALAPTNKLPGSANIEDARKATGNGQPALSRPTPMEVYLQDIRDAEAEADRGKLSDAAGLARACERDGIFSGVMSSRTAGLVSLPKRFRGDPESVAWLSQGYAGIDGNDDPRSVFDLICPLSELAALAADGVMLGCGVGQLVEVEGLDFPLFQRLDPDPLEHREYGDIWIYNSSSGPIQIEPGKGPLVLYAPGGRNFPWRKGVWPAVAKACTRAEHAALGLDEWLRKFADAARVATAPASADENAKKAMHEAAINWGNSSIVMEEGWDLKLLQASAEGANTFIELINTCRQEVIVNIAGQTVTTDGGSGFANADVHKAIRADLIRNTAQQLAECINSQIIPVALAMHFGDDALEERYAFVEWDVSPPKDLIQRANAIVAAGNAVQVLTGQNAATSVKIDVHALMQEFGVPLMAPDAEATVTLSLVPGGKK